MKTLLALHGLGLELRCDAAELVEHVKARLGFFLVETLNAAPSITFDYLMTAEHVVAPPGGTGRAVYNPDEGSVRYYPDSDSLYMTYRDEVRVLCDLRTSAVTVSVLESARHKTWLLSHGVLTLPLLELLKRHGLYSVHAASLVHDGQAYVFAGSSGAGKSTLALGLLRSGFGFQGDDLVLLGRKGEAILSHAFPDELDLTEDTVKLFGLTDVRARGKRPGYPKYSLDVAAQGEVLEHSAPRFLIFPQVSDTAPSRLAPLSKDQAFLELAPNILLTEPGASQAHLDMLAGLVKQCDCYRLETGRDFESLSAQLRSLG